MRYKTKKRNPLVYSYRYIDTSLTGIKLFNTLNESVYMLLKIHI